MDLGFILGIPEEEVVIYVCRNPHNIDSIKAEIISKWIQTFKSEATFETFAEKLHAAGSK